MPAASGEKIAGQSASRRSLRIVFVVAGLVPAVLLGMLAGPLLGYAGFSESRAWSYALPLLVSAIVLMGANVTVLVRHEFATGLASGAARRLGLVSLVGGLLGGFGGGYVAGKLNATSPEDFWGAAAILGLHLCAAMVPIVSGWAALRGARWVQSS